MELLETITLSPEVIFFLSKCFDRLNSITWLKILSIGLAPKLISESSLRQWSIIESSRDTLIFLLESLEFNFFNSKLIILIKDWSEKSEKIMVSSILLANSGVKNDSTFDFIFSFIKSELEDWENPTTPDDFSIISVPRFPVRTIKQLEKSEEIIDLVISEVAKQMGLEVKFKILLSEDSKINESKGVDAAQEVFDVEDIN